MVLYICKWVILWKQTSGSRDLLFNRKIRNKLKYSRILLSRPRLSRITAYLEVKNLVPVHGNLTTCNKILWKRGEIPAFPIFFYLSLASGVKLHIHLLNVVVRFITFLCSANLIGRIRIRIRIRIEVRISRGALESLGLRDNESRLYYISVHLKKLSLNILDNPHVY